MKKIYLLFTALAAVGTLTGCGVFEEFGNEANGTPSPCGTAAILPNSAVSGSKAPAESTAASGTPRPAPLSRCRSFPPHRAPPWRRRARTDDPLAGWTEVRSFDFSRPTMLETELDFIG